MRLLEGGLLCSLPTSLPQLCARKGCILSPCLFNLYAEYMRNTGLEEAQAGIKIAGGNISNFRYADGTTLMEEVRN